jgi:hypothetical protein
VRKIRGGAIYASKYGNLTLPVVLKLTNAAWKTAEQISVPSLRNQYSATYYAAPASSSYSSCSSSSSFPSSLVGLYSRMAAVASLSPVPSSADMAPNNSVSVTGRIIQRYSLLGAKRPCAKSKDAGDCGSRSTVQQQLLLCGVKIACCSLDTVHSVICRHLDTLSSSNTVSAVCWW